MYLKRLRNISDLVLALAALSLVGGVVGGVVVAMSAEDSGRFSTASNEHPNVGLGVIMAASGVVSSALLALIAYWALAWVEVNDQRTVAAQQSHSWEEQRRTMPPPPPVP